MRSDWRDRLTTEATAAAERTQAVVRAIWAWLFARPPRGWLLSWGLVVALAGVAGGSTASAAWVGQSDAVTGQALLSAIAAGGLALVRPLRWPLGVAAALVLGFFESLSAAGASSVGSGLAAAAGGDYNHAQSAFVFLLAFLMWVAGTWLAYCTLRWSRPLLGMVPAIAVVATNVLNFPLQETGASFGLAGLGLGLLLWTAYCGRIQNARLRGLRMSGESRWDFWESGLVAGAALMLVAFVAPPLSTVDRTLDAQSGIIKAWSDVQARLHHELPGGGGPGAAYSTGFSEHVQLGHPLARNSTVVFTYQVIGNHATSLYFRGLDVPATAGGGWQPGTAVRTSGLLPAGNPPPYDETYSAQQNVKVKVQMLRPPAGDTTIYFYPGRLETIDKPAYYEQRGQPLTLNKAGGPVQFPGLSAVDKLTTLDNRPSAGTYTVVGNYSVANADQLRSAGTNYPDWVTPYRSVSEWGEVPYRSPDAEARIAALARQVAGGAKNPYDAATAIENYLRSNLFTYTLKPPSAPAGQDPLVFFVFDSHHGYCEYFATAMGDMLRALGIPTRLVNGYGPGAYDQKTGRFVVRESDAHTWVESYFPTYGWIPFEPTPDGVYFPVPRGQAACHVDSAICEGLATAAGAVPVLPNHFDDTVSVQESAPPVKPRAPLPFDPWRLGLLVLGALALLALVVGARYLTPRSPGAAWRRAKLLGRLAGLAALPAETPIEFGRRLARALPRSADDAARLAGGFTLSAYGPPELAAAGAEDVLAGWRGLRPVLLREAAARAAGRRPAR